MADVASVRTMGLMMRVFLSLLLLVLILLQMTTLWTLTKIRLLLSGACF
jgi:hypothetical protein